MLKTLKTQWQKAIQSYLKMGRKRQFMEEDTQIANNHVEINQGLGKSLPIREMKFETTVRNSDNTKNWVGCKEIESLLYFWWESKMPQPAWENNSLVSFKTKDASTI